MPEQKWPDVLWLVRHGESSGNVARDDAESTGLAVIDIAERDMDVPLSARGEAQARAFGRWMASSAADRLPTAVLTSPYLRAYDTARLALEEAGLLGDVTLVVDERLREREFGALDRLTKRGIEEKFPAEAEARARLGKFYHRPPGGESWADVIMRQRSVLDTLSRTYCGQRVMLVTHQVVVLMYRYLLERMTEREVLDVDRETEIANCSLTEFVFDPARGRQGTLVLTRFNVAAPVADEGEAVTDEPDRRAAAR